MPQGIGQSSIAVFALSACLPNNNKTFLRLVFYVFIATATAASISPFLNLAISQFVFILSSLSLSIFDMPEICKYNRNDVARLNELRNLLVRQPRQTPFSVGRGSRSGRGRGRGRA